MSILKQKKLKVKITKENLIDKTFCIWQYKESVPFTKIVNNDSSYNFTNIEKIIKKEIKGSFEKIFEGTDSLIYINNKTGNIVRISQHWSGSLNSHVKKGKDIKRVDVNMCEGLVYWVIDYKESDMGINQWKVATSNIEDFDTLDIIEGKIINGFGDLVGKKFYEIDGKTISEMIDHYLDKN